MLYSAIFGVFTFILMLVAFQAEAGTLARKDSDGQWKLTPLRGMTKKEGLISFGVALAVFILSAIAMSLKTRGNAGIAIALSGLILAINIGLMVWSYKMDGIVDSLAFIALYVVLYLAAKGAMLVGVVVVKSPAVGIFLAQLPLIVLIIAIGYEIVTFLIERFKEARQSGTKILKISYGILAPAVAIGMVLALVFGAIIPIATYASDGSGEKRQVTEESIKDLTVRKVTPEDLEKLTVKKYVGISETLLDSSLTPHDKERTEATGFTDALTFGFTTWTEQDKMFHELEEEILRNPVYGVTVANALKDKRIGSITIGSLNSWMGEMVAKNKEGVFVWCEYRDETDTIYVTTEYRCFAATLCTFLERLVNHGVGIRQTSENWCLNASAENNTRAGILAEYQYEKQALILTYTGKNGGEFLTVGFNVHDKRPEFFTNREITTETEPSGETSTSPPPTSPPTTPTTPTPTPKPEPEPDTTLHKDPKDGTQGDKVKKSDNPGPGEDTNNGVKDQPQNSNHYPSYEKYRTDMDHLEQVNTNQKTGNDSNTPSYTPPVTNKVEPATTVKVDNSGDTGNGGAPINKQTPTQAPAIAADTNKEISTQPAGEWNGPQD